MKTRELWVSIQSQSKQILIVHTAYIQLLIRSCHMSQYSSVHNIPGLMGERTRFQDYHQSRNRIKFSLKALGTFKGTVHEI